MDVQYVNKVPWLTIYEFVIILYLNVGTPILAFTTKNMPWHKSQSIIFFKNVKKRETNCERNVICHESIERTVFRAFVGRVQTGLYRLEKHDQKA